MSESPPVGAPSAGGIRSVDLLGVYVDDHLAAATGGVELVSRMLSHHRGSPYEPELEELLDQFREERSAHLAMAGALGIPCGRTSSWAPGWRRSSRVPSSPAA